MEAIGKATQFVQSAMDMANRIAKQQSDSPVGAGFQAQLQDQANRIQEGFATQAQTLPMNPGSNPGTAFSDMVSKLAGDVSMKQAQAGDAWQGVLSGQGVPLHQAVIASEEAAVSFQLMVEVRNKLLESYKELMRMQA
jgi:flagellar hook-basal body complex protein FliE